MRLFINTFFPPSLKSLLKLLYARSTPSRLSSAFANTEMPSGEPGDMLFSIFGITIENRGTFPPVVISSSIPPGSSCFIRLPSSALKYSFVITYCPSISLCVSRYIIFSPSCSTSEANTTSVILPACTDRGIMWSADRYSILIFIFGFEIILLFLPSFIFSALNTNAPVPNAKLFSISRLPC